MIFDEHVVFAEFTHGGEQATKPGSQCERARTGRSEMRTKTGELQKKIDAFNASTRAQALLIAIEWAGGNARALSRAAGLDDNTASLWTYRKRIPPRAALVLEKLPGFPLTAREMCPGVDWARFKKRQCQRCGVTIYPPNYHPGCSSFLKVPGKRSRKLSPRSVTT